MGFWKKAGIGALIGLCFGIMAACGFIGFRIIAGRFFPNKTQVTAEQADTANEENPGSTEDASGSGSNEKVEKATLIKAVDGDKSSSSGSGMSVSELAKNNLPCVVSITNTSVQTLRDMWGSWREFENVSRGSGIIIGQTDDELLIVTNSHVVSGADSITVGFVDSEIYDAEVKGADDDMDIAVIGVKMSDLKKDTTDQIKIAVIGDSDNLEVGEQVVAIGNAIGYGQSVTTGIVSAMGRDIPDDEVDTQYIQTDAAINPGNSGGALLNMKGEVIGINAAKIANTYVEGIGYAIPINDAEPTIENLMNRKTRDRVEDDKAGYLGITGVSVDAQTSKMYGIPEGIFLSEVVEDGPADKAGLLKGDIVKKFDGISVSSIAELREKMDYYEAGEKVEVTFCRQENGEYVDKTVTVTLSTKSDVGFDEDGNGSGKEDSDKGKSDRPKEDERPTDGKGGRNNEMEIPDEVMEFFFGFGQ